ncbi:MAG: AAA family ATPase, partial [Erysipelotrichaceae bacterium]|nr:AAA family ATPase [Erysipelotrichaceae bacterium]
MFLKRIEMQGFKSFADKVTISFEHSVTGIVGPNGCGKSNITDAVRWVLGEQSVKSLRGTSMTDVIFAGSADRRMVGLAEVTLVFDNSRHQLNSELDEIEVTRRIYRSNKEAEYLINKKPVRLKDIIDLILDSGLGKDSLSMISQGNIQQFAEAKPIDRRAIFEEAAGVAKYKKRKLESLSKLTKVKENLERCNDIVAELEKQVTPLKRAARKAEIYREKKQRLQEIETAVLVAEIKQLSQSVEETKKTLFDIDSQTAMYETSITMNENQNEESRKQSNALERDVNILQDELMHLLNEIQVLEQRKIEIDEKSKYVLEVGNIEEKAKELKNLVNEARIEFEDREQRYEKLHQEIQLLQQELSQAALDLADENQKNSQANIALNRLANRKAVLENMIKDPFS